MLHKKSSKKIKKAQKNASFAPGHFTAQKRYPAA
jgi:hypothetical protein